jgi:uncharacterized OsmC-like protein
MLASCVATMIGMYARGWELGKVGVEAVYDPEPTPRHVALGVSLPAGLTTDQVRRLRRVAQTCPARRALEAGFSFDEEFVVERAETVAS